MAGSLVCLCLCFCIFPFSTLRLSLCVRLQSEGRVSFTVTTCEIVFQEDGCFLLYSWHPVKHSHLQNCLIWMPWRRTHIHSFIHANTVHVHAHKHEDINVLLASLHTCKHTIFFLLASKTMHGWCLLVLMMKSGSDNAALSRVDALQHSAAMLRKSSVSPHWEHGGFSSSVVHQCTLALLLLFCFISGVPWWHSLTVA